MAIYPSPPQFPSRSLSSLVCPHCVEHILLICVIGGGFRLFISKLHKMKATFPPLLNGTNHSGSEMVVYLIMHIILCCCTRVIFHMLKDDHKTVQCVHPTPV